ncbi:MAG: hypothetical protein ACOYXB_04055 [Bacteroidota bacterium]
MLLTLLSGGCDPNKGPDTFSSPEGIYSCQENSVYSGYRKYLVELNRKQDNTSVYIISNFHNQGDNEFVYATIIGDSIYISDQLISNLLVSGKGKVDNDFKQITLQYQTSDGITDLDFYAVYSR